METNRKKKLLNHDWTMLESVYTSQMNSFFSISVGFYEFI